jgi:CRISPR type III-A-associated RAMP protein Csm4
MGTKTYRVIKMKFTSPLHISRGQTNYYDQSEKVIHSDTLKSALFSIGKKTWGDDIGERFFDSFLLSSAFPYKESHLFFPKPMVKLPIKIQGHGKEDEGRENKIMKKIEYLEKELFVEVLKGEEINVSEKQFVGKGIFVTEQPLAKTFQIFKSELQQRVFVPRGGNADTEPYYVDRLCFNEKSGLFFLMDCKDESFDQIAQLLNILADEGIGTDRSSGNGQFEVEHDELTMSYPDDADMQMALGLYCPAEDEINDRLLKNSSYLLTKRGGYIAGSTQTEHYSKRKKYVYMFQTGSVFPEENELKGKRVDLRPDNIGEIHPVWRDGRTLFIPMKKMKEDEQNI